MKTGTLCITVDVEDWFQSENLREAHPPGSWQDRELRVEASVNRVLEVLAESDVKGTFFILGWIAERIPALVRTIAGAGHEIASHGHGHIINYSMKEEEIRRDVTVSKRILEDLSGTEVIGYRAPCFSVSDGLLDLLAEAGYRYDSSLNPFAIHDRYGKISGTLSPGGPFRHRSGIIEYPMPMGSFLGMRFPISGGGYFRLFPYRFFSAMVFRYLKANEVYIFYMHPWEVDPLQPKTRVKNPGHTFRHYHGLAGTLGKLRRLLTIPGEKKTLGEMAVGFQS
jgi:polysaccharide deacetylase family protein (PEP-CTERM system associated)